MKVNVLYYQRSMLRNILESSNVLDKSRHTRKNILETLISSKKFVLSLTNIYHIRRMSGTNLKLIQFKLTITYCD